MPQIAFDRYYRYEELTGLLKAYEAEYPNLVSVASMGKSFEGRDIWVVAVTNKATGPAEEKPAFWCDGNIHASEVSASTTVLHLLNKLCLGYSGKPPDRSEKSDLSDKIKRLLDTRAMYLVPRLNPDGAEWALESPPRIIRSSTRPYPYDEDDPYGIEPKDADGDGRILCMRIKDQNGPWKVCVQEPRILERRDPTDVGGTYFRVLPEGLIHNWDGMTIKDRKRKQGLDMNRNFPSAWRLEFEQHGAGPFPTSEPEIHAQVKFIAEHPNICGAVCFHTFSGVHLRPPSRMPDDDIPPEDLWVFQKLGDKGKEMTGYPAISNFHEFKYHPKEVITGVFDDWMYEHRGVYSWTTEIWSPQRQAGITDYKYIDWFREHPVEHDIQMLKWSDEKLEGKGYVDWYPFRHPQLGEVELGGWDSHYAFRNPPPRYLEAEVAPLGDWCIWQALCSPKLELREVKVERLPSLGFAEGETEGGAGGGRPVARIRIAVQNTGWLPTNVTKIGTDRKLCRGVTCEIAKEGEDRNPEGKSAPEWLISGELRQIGPQLVGWSHTAPGGFGWHSDPTDDVAVFEWVVQGPGTYAFVARHDRAGVVRTSVTVE
ncbi:MAG: carboxypeptidase [Armatimonadetes bacterium]|nr:carboxypeptidase [Armatimonadota bacterium]